MRRHVVANFPPAVWDVDCSYPSPRSSSGLVSQPLPTMRRRPATGRPPKRDPGGGTVRGHIHKREHKGKNGKTVRWYVVVDVGRDEAGRRQQKWHGGFKTR